MLHPTNLNLDWSQFTHLELGASSGSRINGMLMPMESSNNGELLCARLEEFICEYPVTFSPTGMIEFIKRKQEGNIPKLARLKKVALRFDIERDRHEGTDGLLSKL
ncbi:hypothetical protein M413DRAFT_445791, partial [Hebeloma cylindrosporum]